MKTLWQDIRYASRAMRRNSGVTVVAALTLALGIGANTVIFSLVNGLMLKSLPYPYDEQLVTIWNDNRRAGLHQDALSYANLVDYRSQSQSLQSIGAFYESSMTFSDT